MQGKSPEVRNFISMMMTRFTTPKMVKDERNLKKSGDKPQKGISEFILLRTS
jgi:hypothetical protein